MENQPLGTFICTGAEGPAAFASAAVRRNSLSAEAPGKTGEATPEMKPVAESIVLFGINHAGESRPLRSPVLPRVKEVFKKVAAQLPRIR